MKQLILICTLVVLSSTAAFASTAGCEGKVNGKKLSFAAQGSISDREDGLGFVKIDGKKVASFDGAAAYISYIKRTFYIENSRGDVVDGKLNNIFNGDATLRRLSLPGEGLELENVPVKCWFKR